MNNKIRHEGIIDSIERECVHVRILQTSACAACKVAGYCNAAEAKEKIVDVYHTDVSGLKVGDAVHAWLITRCADQKTKDGGTFKANRTKVYHIAKIRDFAEVPPHF